MTSFDLEIIDSLDSVGVVLQNENLVHLVQRNNQFKFIVRLNVWDLGPMLSKNRKLFWWKGRLWLLYLKQMNFPIGIVHWTFFETVNFQFAFPSYDQYFIINPVKNVSITNLELILQLQRSKNFSFFYVSRTDFPTFLFNIK